MNEKRIKPDRIKHLKAFFDWTKAGPRHSPAALFAFDFRKISYCLQVSNLIYEQETHTFVYVQEGIELLIIKDIFYSWTFVLKAPSLNFYISDVTNKINKLTQNNIN